MESDGKKERERERDRRKKTEFNDEANENVTVRNKLFGANKRNRFIFNI